ncbi:hypothetical protein, partial [Streptomyces sp. DT17]
MDPAPRATPRTTKAESSPATGASNPATSSSRSPAVITARCSSPARDTTDEHPTSTSAALDERTCSSN